MQFEKWQALGNDYLIVEAYATSPSRSRAATVRRLCDRHTGPGADGVLELSPPRRSPGFVARLRIFNPDGSEAELSGNGAREAIMYLRGRGRRIEDEFSIADAAGEIRPTILGPTRAASTWAARALALASTSPAGRRTAPARSPGRAFQHVAIGNPQCAIRGRPTRAELEALDLPAIGPAIEHDPQFPNRTNVSFWCATGGARSARASSSAAWGRPDRRAPARAAPRSRSCCAAAARP